MTAILYQFALLATFAAGIGLLLRAPGQLSRYEQTLDAIQRAGVEYIGENCRRVGGQGGLPDTVSAPQLQAAGNLSAAFDDQGVAFTWDLAAHPVVSVTASGNAEYLAFLAGRTPGSFAADGSYRFMPSYGTSLFRAANNGYNLFVYDAYEAACAGSG